jgi:hypothetical protein
MDKPDKNKTWTLRKYYSDGRPQWLAGPFTEEYARESAKRSAGSKGIERIDMTEDHGDRLVRLWKAE